jgi:translation initiation factor 1
MSKKIVYSTNPTWVPTEESDEMDTLPIQQQKLRIRLETKQRGGKKATIVQGFVGTIDDLETLAKTIKVKLGTGGSAKDGEILIQGDYVSKTKELLLGLGYKDTK